MSHTPGPWNTDEEFNSECVVASDGVLVADCSILSHRTPNECQANARLIAAAPDLLEAARSAADDIEEAREGKYDDPRDGAYLLGCAIKCLRAAIAKAEGTE